MADTIVTNSPRDTSDSAAGWVIAVIVLLVAGFLWYMFNAGYLNGNAARPAGTTNVNVSVPNPIQAAPSPAPATGGANTQ